MSTALYAILKDFDQGKAEIVLKLAGLFTEVISEQTKATHVIAAIYIGALLLQEPRPKNFKADLQRAVVRFRKQSFFPEKMLPKYLSALYKEAVSVPAGSKDELQAGDQAEQEGPEENMKRVPTLLRIPARPMPKPRPLRGQLLR